jgi:spore coat polysaccharide biosynthesis protein SpsF (cytidylyltransferase family)
MRAVVAVQARLSSSRLPRKVLVDVGGKPMLAQIVRRCKATTFPVYLSCPPEDAEDIGKAVPGVEIVPGPEKDILWRMLLVAARAKATHLVRVTGDCPLVPHDLIVRAAEEAEKSKAACVQSWRPRTFPDGFDFEVWHVPFLVTLAAKLQGDDREWFASWCLDKGMPSIPITSAGENLSKMRLTVDYPEDLEVIRAIYEDMGEEIWESGRVVSWCKMHPATMRKNQDRVTDFGKRPEAV